jgi:hypothetical protein
MSAIEALRVGADENRAAPTLVEDVHNQPRLWNRSASATLAAATPGIAAPRPRDTSATVFGSR